MTRYEIQNYHGLSLNDVQLCWLTKYSDYPFSQITVYSDQKLILFFFAMAHEIMLYENFSKMYSLHVAKTVVALQLRGM